MTDDTTTETDTEQSDDTDTDDGAPTYRVLVPVDQSEERALAQAEYVADLPAAADRVEAVLLHVFTAEESEAIPESLGTYKSADRIVSVRRAGEYLEERGVSVTAVDASGAASDAILRAADRHDVAVVVVGGRKRSTAEEAIFGSVTQSVLHGTDRPVVVTGDSHV